jgi:NAD(P)-dependent dehydrogenase (short-subunit alcohol dehydrogenase family)
MAEEGKVAVVTGANRGLGLETCRRLAERGYRVILGSRAPARGRAAAAPLVARGLSVVPMALDVTDFDEIDSFWGEVAAQFGRVDVLVNNAGVLLDRGRGVLTVDVDTFRMTMEANVLGPLRLCQLIVPDMLRRGYGRVVNVSSRLGQLSTMGDRSPAYAASKAALNALTRLVAGAAHGANVLVNAAAPGWVRTDMGGPNAPRSLEEGTDTIVWLATLPDGGPSGEFFYDRAPVPW